MPTPKKLALYVAAGALTAALASTPALAEQRPATDQQPVAEQQPAAEQQPVAEHPRHTEGRVTARGGLKLRDKPTRSSRIIRVEPYGATVHIFCKTTGDHVEGNNHWYLLTDGTWAWGSAQYIVPRDGHSPRWC
ncbi:SH3 domain-containing protein [Streptomyces sp. NPDC021093]|uniref:SH3 domain-containing protein n=1 Tax=Streptomyces sp. NPDC021093 TaxID=3365112 RepID=UPI0037B4BAF6